MNYGRRYGEARDARRGRDAAKKRRDAKEEGSRTNEARDKVRGCAGAETLIPSYIGQLTEQRFFPVNDFDFDSACWNEINRQSRYFPNLS